MPNRGSDTAPDAAVGEDAAKVLFDEGHRLLADDRLHEAIRCFATLIREYPDYAPSYLTMARLALEAGEPNVCIATLERGLAKLGENVDLRFKLALVHQREGRLEVARDHYARIVAEESEHAGAWLKLGVCNGEIGDTEAGAVAVQRAILLNPELRDAASDESLPEVMRAEIKAANLLLRSRYTEMVEESLATTRSKFPGVDLNRLEEAFAFLQGKPKRWCHEGQRPGFLLFPEMPARPWYEREEFDWVARVEAATPLILDELSGLTRNPEGFAPYLIGVSKSRATITKTGEDFSVLADSMEWNAFHLMKAGPVQENMDRCPRTVELMQSLPMAEARNYMPEIFFSVLRPGAHIVPHFGQMNIRLTVHLGLVVPEGCGIRVHEETRDWEQGKVLIFDDSFKHEAWNRSNSDRVVLIFEVWNPDLSAAEIFGIQEFLELRGAWMAQFPKPDMSIHAPASD